jgi:hypothetical protein
LSVHMDANIEPLRFRLGREGSVTMPPRHMTSDQWQWSSSGSNESELCWLAQSFLTARGISQSLAVGCTQHSLASSSMTKVGRREMR